MSYGVQYFDAETDIRRNYIYEKFFFECDCLPCSEEWSMSTLDDPSWPAELEGAK